MGDKGTAFKWKAAVAIIAGLLYINSLGGGLLFDDEGAINENLDVTDHSTPLSNLLENDFWGTPMSSHQSHKSWRPLTVASFRANHVYHGLDPKGYHAVNLILHVVASVLFIDVCDVIFLPNTGLSVAAGFLFAAHPIHTEAVAGVVGRAEELSAIFMMASFLLYVGSVHSCSSVGMIFKTFLAQTCVLVALLCKETGIAAIGVNTAYDCFLAYHKLYPGMKAQDEASKSKKDDSETSSDFEKHVSNYSLHLNQRTYRSCSPPKAKKSTSFAGHYGSLLFRIVLSTICGGLFLMKRLSLSTPPKFPYNSNPMAFADSRQTRVLSRLYIWALNLWLLLVPNSLCADWSSGSVPLVKRKHSQK
jgi:hypothetical protein